MKARVKATGEIVDVIQVGTKTHLFDLNNVEFLDNPQDYWTRLEHTYAGMAMQGLISLSEWPEETTDVDVIETASKYAHALVEKMKEAKA